MEKEETSILMDKNEDDHKKEQSLICDFCNFALPDRASLIKHITEKHLETPKKSFQCDLCDYRAEDKALVEKHAKNQHFKCDLCDFVAEDKSIKDDHIRGKYFSERVEVL